MNEPVRILKSHADAIGNFSAMVAEYIKALEEHRSLTGVAAPKPPHPLVERAVQRVQYPIEATHQPMRLRSVETDKGTFTVEEPDGEPVRFQSSAKPDDFIANYEIINDAPLPITLEQRKQALEGELLNQSKLAREAVVPPRRRLLADLKAQEAKSAETPSPEQTAFVVEYDAMQQRLVTVQRHFAEQLNEIEDLTEETIGAWKPKPFLT